MTYYLITHRTGYNYSTGVALCHNEARLLPRPTPWQICGESRWAIRPKPALALERQDFFSNRVLYFVVQDIHSHLDVVVETRVQMHSRSFTLATPSPPWEDVVEILQSNLDPEIIEARQFILNSPFIGQNKNLRDYAISSFPPQRPLLEGVMDLTCRVHEDFRYDASFTNIATPLSEVLENRRGVCQDFAHLAVGCLRSLGLAARYVSGYLETTPPPGQSRLVGADASHAWLDVFVPYLGWAEFDPTNNCMADKKHIVLSWGRDYGDVAPLKGVMSGGGAHSLEVSVDVAPQGDTV